MSSQAAELLSDYPAPGHPDNPVGSGYPRIPVTKDPPPLTAQPPSGPSPDHEGDANAYGPDG